MREHGGREPNIESTQIVRRGWRSRWKPEIVEGSLGEMSGRTGPDPHRQTDPPPFPQEHPRTTLPSYAASVSPEARRSLGRISRAIYWVFGVIESLIAIRAVLRLLGANAANSFASLIYGVTNPLVAPFRGIFTDPVLGTSVLELSSLVAIVVYALLAYALVRLLYLFSD